MKNQKNPPKNALMVLWTLLPFAKIKYNPFHAISEPESGGQFKLYTNYPNPFSTITIIYFALMHPSHVEIHINDLSGKKILIVTDERYEAGIQRIPLYKVMNDTTLSSGRYQYQLKVSNINGVFIQHKFLTVL
jgi:hypothetical protein